MIRILILCTLIGYFDVVAAAGDEKLPQTSEGLLEYSMGHPDKKWKTPKVKDENEVITEKSRQDWFRFIGHPLTENELSVFKQVLTVSKCHYMDYNSDPVPGPNRERVDLPPKKWTQFTQPWRASRTLPARDNPELSVDVPGCTTSQSMRRSPV